MRIGGVVSTPGSTGRPACPSRCASTAASPTCASTAGGASTCRGLKRYVGPGFAESPDRYELEVLGGASKVTVD